MRKWWNFRCYTIIFFILLIFCNFGWTESIKSKADEHIERILSLALSSQESSDNMKKKAAFEDAIDNIDKIGLNNEELMSLYIGLLDYYIGESTGEVLSKKITYIGDKILPFLVEKKNMPIKCIKKYNTLCSYETHAERNIKIIRMITAIKQGRVLYAEFPDNLREQHEKDLKIIHIFIQDYKNMTSTLPNNLDILREYAWREYGYKLNIYSPWFGKPLKYSPQKDGKYILEPGDDKP